jgi:putative phosphoribosyl transferase
MRADLHGCIMVSMDASAFGANGVLFASRRAAGAELARALELPPEPRTVVVGLARGGIEVAAEIARRLHLALDVVAVRKLGHPWQPDQTLGAVAPGGAAYLGTRGSLSERTVAELVAASSAESDALDAKLHGALPRHALAGRSCLLVDDGVATGATMMAAIRWARAKSPSAILVAVPVASTAGADLVRSEADAFVSPFERDDLASIGPYFRDFAQIDDQRVIDLLEQAAARSRRPTCARA